MPRTRVKICGITRPEDAALAAELGVDAIGLNFVGGPRQISYAWAAEIIDDLPALTTVVGLVTAPSRENPNSPTIRELQGYDQRDYSLSIRVFQTYGDALLTLHGLLETDYRIAFHYWPVVHVQSRQFAAKITAFLGKQDRPLNRIRPQAVILDTASQSKLGGTGQSFDWNWIAEARAAGELEGLPPIILAGGLNPDNVAEAIRIARPWAVDVSSGVEVAGKPGIKDPAKMRDFIQAAQGA